MDRKVGLWSSNPGEAFHAAAYRKVLDRHPVATYVPREQVTNAPDLSAAVSLAANHDEAESEAFWKSLYRPAGRLVSDAEPTKHLTR